jgi:predicted DNA-binding protein YlxM (UPF0122 family)
LHLKLATHKENSRRRVNSKLTIEQVEKIRIMLLNGMSLKKIADIFKVSKQMIWLIAKGKQWN